LNESFNENNEQIISNLINNISNNWKNQILISSCKEEINIEIIKILFKTLE